MKGREALFSAAIEVLTRPLVEDGAKADTDPARRAVIAAIFIIFRYLVCSLDVDHQRWYHMKHLQQRFLQLRYWYELLVRHLRYRDFTAMKKDLCSTTPTRQSQMERIYFGEHTLSDSQTINLNKIF
jgi:hypothetical protein